MRFCPCSVFCLEPAVRERLELGESVSTPERLEADINRQRRLTDNFKMCTQIWL
jgi:hypothetical protein